MQFALNVSNLDEAVEFYSKFFDTPNQRRSVAGTPTSHRRTAAEIGPH